MDLDKVFGINSYYSEQNRAESFQELCSQDLQAINIKKIFLKLDYKSKLTQKVLSQGLLGALENNQDKYVELIVNYMEKNNIKIDFYVLTQALMIAIEKTKDKNINILLDYMGKSDFDIDKDFCRLQLIFNCATAANNIDLMKKLDEKYSIIEKSITRDIGDYISLVKGSQSASATIQDDGSLSFGGSFGGEQSELENKLDNYSYNPIIFNLNRFNVELVDSFFKNDYQIHPSVVEQAIVSNIYIDNSEAVVFLFANEKCANIIKHSEKIIAFINSDVDWADRKKEARIALAMIELNDELVDNNTVKNKMKI